MKLLRINKRHRCPCTCRCGRRQKHFLYGDDVTSTNPTNTALLQDNTQTQVWLYLMGRWEKVFLPICSIDSFIDYWDSNWLLIKMFQSKTFSKKLSCSKLLSPCCCNIQYCSLVAGERMQSVWIIKILYYWQSKICYLTNKNHVKVHGLYTKHYSILHCSY